MNTEQPERPQPLIDYINGDAVLNPEIAAYISSIESMLFSYRYHAALEASITLRDESIKTLAETEFKLRASLDPFASIGIEYWPKNVTYYGVSLRRDMIERAREVLGRKPEAIK